MLTADRPAAVLRQVDIEASARKHGVSEGDMLHALRHHWRAFETDDPHVTMFIGPFGTGAPLEVGVVSDGRRDCDGPCDEGTYEVPRRMVDAVTKTRAQRAVDLEAWADQVAAEELRKAEPQGLRTTAELVDKRDHLEEELTAAVQAAVS